jgi:hypothetical protein
MHVISAVRRATVAMAVLSGIFGAAAIDSAAPGIASAEAKNYYTKKRVNGQWITGRFPKKSFAKSKPATKAAAKTTPADEAAKPEPEPAAVPASVAAPAPVVGPAPVPEAPPPPAAVAQPAPLAPLSNDERMKKLQEALKARAENLLVSNPPAEPRAARQDPPHPISTASIALSKQPLPPAPADPRSVTLDFGSGVKTTIFADGAIATEPFDVKAMKDLAARRGNPPSR